MTDEQQWNRLKEEYYCSNSEFLNYLQMVTASDLGNPDTVKQLIAMRHRLIDASLHIFMFVEDASQDRFMSTLPGKERS